MLEDASESILFFLVFGITDLICKEKVTDYFQRFVFMSNKGGV